MKLSVIKTLYENTSLNSFPDKIKREIFELIDINSIAEITNETIQDVITKINTCLEQKELSQEEIEAFFIKKDIGFDGWKYQPSWAQLKYAMEIFREVYDRWITQEDIEEIFQEHKILGLHEILSDSRELILWHKDLQNTIDLSQQYYSLIKLPNDIKSIISSNFFRKISCNIYQQEHINHYLEVATKIQGIPSFNLSSLETFTPSEYKQHESWFENLFKYIKLFKISDFNEINTEEFKAIYNIYNDPSKIETLSKIYWKTLSINDINSGLILQLAEIFWNSYHSGKFSHCCMFISSYIWIQNINLNNRHNRVKINKMIKLLFNSLKHVEKIKGFCEYYTSLTGSKIIPDLFSDRWVVSFIKKLMKEFLWQNEPFYDSFFKKFPQYSFKDQNDILHLKPWSPELFLWESDTKYNIMYSKTVEFMLIFINEVENYVEMESSEWFQNFSNLMDGHKGITILILRLVREHNLFPCKLEDITPELLDSVTSHYPTSHKIRNINFPKWFFDISINDGSFLNQWVLPHLLESKHAYWNLECIYKQYFHDTPTLSNLNNAFEALIKTPKFKILVWDEDLKNSINFILNRYGSEMSLENLFHILREQNELIDSKDTDRVKEVCENKICEITGVSREQLIASYFIKNKDGMISLNEEKKYFFRVLMTVWLPQLDELKSIYPAITVWKITKLYRDTKIFYSAYLWNAALAGNQDPYNFLIKQALDVNSYDHLEANLHILDVIKNQYSWDITVEKLKIILAKTGGILTRTFLETFIIHQGSEEELDISISNFQETRKKLLSSEDLGDLKIDTTFIESVMLAYKPSWFSEEDIELYLKDSLVDNTEHLEQIQYSKSGYKSVISTTEYSLKDDTKVNDSSVASIEWLLSVTKNLQPLDLNNFNYKIFFSRASELPKLLTTISALYSINLDCRINAYRELMEDGEKNYSYERLKKLQEIFWVVTKDSFQAIILEKTYLLNNNELVSIFEKLWKIKDRKFQAELAIVQWENKHIALANLLYNQLRNITQKIRQQIEKELRKFNKQVDWERQIIYMPSKNIASFFALAGNDLCTSDNIDRHNEKRYIPINIVDPNKQEIIGIIMLYIEDNREYLIVRWFNIRQDDMNSFDIKNLCKSMLNFICNIAKENWYDRVYIPPQDSWHAVSNRSSIGKEILKQSKKLSSLPHYKIENAEFYAGEVGEGGFETLYLLEDLENNKKITTLNSN